VNRSSFASTTLRNVAWLAGGQALRQVISITSTVVLARLLVPADYGVFAMVAFTTELGQLILSFGLGAALVQRKELDQRLLASCFWANLGLGVLVGLALLASSQWIADYFEQPAMRWLLLGGAFNIVVSTLGVIPQTLIMRSLDLSRIAIGGLYGSLAGMVVAVALAASGFGVWALIIQPIVGTAINTGYLFAKVRWWPTLQFSLDELRSVARFSLNTLGSNVFSHITKNLQSLILGPTLGAASLGLITMAQTVVWLPMAQISQTAVKATFPVFSQLQGDKARAAQALYRSSGLIALVSLPLFAGIAVLAEDLLSVVLGAQWITATPLVVVFCVMSVVSSTTALADTVLMSQARTDRLLHVAVATLPLTAVPMWMVRHDPILHAVIVMAVATVVIKATTLALALRAIDGTWRDFLGQIWRALAGSLVMAGILELASRELTHFASPVRLVLLALLGAVAYGLWTLLLNPAPMRDLLSAARTK
jgi:O-antigen/teichoic acid export membrane protein